MTMNKVKYDIVLGNPTPEDVAAIFENPQFINHAARGNGFEILKNFMLKKSSPLIGKGLSIKNNTIIFSHFMVMNVLASYANSEQRLLSFYPDYTSFIKIVLRNESIYSIELDKEKKTKINI